MPRIYEQPDNEPRDFCRSCYPKVAAKAGPDDDLDAEHPPYEDTDYDCEQCGRKLTSRDDYPKGV